MCCPFGGCPSRGVVPPAWRHCAFCSRAAAVPQGAGEGHWGRCPALRASAGAPPLHLSMLVLCAWPQIAMYPRCAPRLVGVGGCPRELCAMALYPGWLGSWRGTSPLALAPCPGRLPRSLCTPRAPGPVSAGIGTFIKVGGGPVHVPPPPRRKGPVGCGGHDRGTLLVLVRWYDHHHNPCSPPSWPPVALHVHGVQLPCSAVDTCSTCQTLRTGEQTVRSCWRWSDGTTATAIPAAHTVWCPIPSLFKLHGHLHDRRLGSTCQTM